MSWDNTRGGLAGLAALGLVIGMTASGSTAQATGAPDQERIVSSAFLFERGGARVSTMDPDGSARARVDVPADLEDFNKTTWSHDGQRLLYSNVLVFDDDGDLVAFRPAISAPDGSHYRLLRMRWRPMDFYCSAWSNDDSRLLCSTQHSVISVRASDGRGTRRLTRNRFGGQDLAIGYSPDGSMLAWLRERPDRHPDDDVDGEREALYVANADGSQARRVTRWGLLQAHEFAGGSWSPGGSRIASTTRKGKLVEVDVATGAVLPVPVDLRDSDFAVMPDYSPDGLRVVFAMFRNAPTDLFVVNLDGSALHRVTRTPAKAELSPDWK